MALTTYNITATLLDQSGDPIPNAVVTAILTKADIDPTEGWIQPEAQEFTGDALGQLTMALWPNALGSEGSQYQIVAKDAEGELLFVVLADVPEADSDLFDISVATPPIQPYPVQDSEREARVVQDVADLLHDSTPSDETTRKIKRWINHVLSEAKTKNKWWFLRNSVTRTIQAGSDVIDLSGHVDRIISVFCPKQLHKTSLSNIIKLRQQAIADGSNNAASECTHYALEAGRRLHLWPAPSEPILFSALYTRPMAIEIVPDEWEPIILNGVIGLFGRHFDRDALTADPQEFERRFYNQLRTANIEDWDVDSSLHWADDLPDASVSANSSVDTATAIVMPASLTGIGYVCVYPLEV